MRNKFHCVEVTAETAGRCDNGNACIFKLVAEIFDELRALSDNVFVHCVVKPNADSFHLFNAHAAESGEALKA